MKKLRKVPKSNVVLIQDIPHIRTWDELVKIPVGTTIRYGPTKALVHAFRMGQVLIEYLEPCNWGRFFTWSSGGGQGLPDEPDKALARFNEICSRTVSYWNERFALNRSIIVKGVHFMDGGEEKKSHDPWSPQMLGFAGARWWIQELSTGKVFTTNNLWHQGLIPIELARPDTHRFLENKLEMACR